MSISKTDSNSNQDQGLKSQLKKIMGSGLSKLLSLPDKPETPAGRKAARIAADIFICGMGVAIFAATSSGFNPAILTNPSLTNMMTLPLGLAVSGVGIAWLLEDSISKKYHRILGKIMACTMPLLILGASSCFIASGFQSNLPGPTTLGAYWLVGLLVLPLSAFAIGWAGERLSQNKVEFVKGDLPVTSYARNERRIQSLRASRRLLDLGQKQSLRQRHILSQESQTVTSDSE